MDTKELERMNSISIRERLAISILLYIVRIIAPWTYDHQFREVSEDLRELITGKKAEKK